MLNKKLAVLHNISSYWVGLERRVFVAKIGKKDLNAINFTINECIVNIWISVWIETKVNDLSESEFWLKVGLSYFHPWQHPTSNL